MAVMGIYDYLSGLTGFVFDRAVLERIAHERGVSDVTDVSTLEQKQKDLLLADLLLTVYLSPNSSASYSEAHGSYKKSIGSQTLNEKKSIYNMLVSLYRKWNDEKLESISDTEGGLQWLDY